MSDPEYRRRRLIVGVGLVAVVAVIVAVVIAVGNDDDSPPAKPPASAATVPGGATDAPHTTELLGDGDEETKPFEVGENWELQWETEGRSFTAELVTTDGQSRGNIVQASGQPSGSTFVVEAGRFRLRIRSDGQWKARVVDRSG